MSVRTQMVFWPTLCFTLLSHKQRRCLNLRCVRDFVKGVDLCLLATWYQPAAPIIRVAVSRTQTSVVYREGNPSTRARAHTHTHTHTHPHTHTHTHTPHTPTPTHTHTHTTHKHHTHTQTHTHTPHTLTHTHRQTHTHTPHTHTHTALDLKFIVQVCAA